MYETWTLNEPKVLFTWGNGSVTLLVPTLPKYYITAKIHTVYFCSWWIQQLCFVAKSPECLLSMKSTIFDDGFTLSQSKVLCTLGNSGVTLWVPSTLSKYYITFKIHTVCFCSKLTALYSIQFGSCMYLYIVQ